MSSTTNALKYNASTPVSDTSDFSHRSVFREGILAIIGLMLVSYVNLNAPRPISIIVQVLMLILYYFSTKNYLWLFVLCLISFSPGDLFTNSYGGSLILTTTPGLGSITFEMMLILLFWLKYASRKVPVFYSVQFFIVILYMLLLLPVFGAKPASFGKMLIYYSLLLLLPRMLNRQEDFDKLFFLIFIANIFVFFANIFQMVTGQALVELFAGKINVFGDYDSEVFVRTVGGIQFAHLSVVGGLIYLSKKNSPFKVFLPYIGLVTGILNIVFSATRGWILSVLFLLLAYSFFMLPRLFRNILIVLPITAIAVGIAWQVPVVRHQINSAYERVLYFEDILSPDLNAETTDIGRVRRGARVMDKFSESPIIGFGLGNVFRQYGDGHTGNQTMLLSFGLVGYILFLFLWLGFVFKLVTQDRFLTPQNPEYKLSFLLALSFLSVFIIHSTSGGFLHPALGGAATIWYGIIFAYGNMLYYKHMQIYGGRRGNKRQLLHKASNRID